MAFCPHSLSLHTIESEEIQSNKILSNSTNTYINNRRRRQRESLALASVRRYKYALKRKNQLEALSLDTSRIPVDLEPIMEIQNFQRAQSQRAMYNARQTPLIPFITDIDRSVLVELSATPNDLLIDVLNLIANIDEECSFFEQFKI